MDTELTALLRKALDEKLDGNESELARLVDTSQQNINNYLNGKVLKPSYWRKVNAVLGLQDDDVAALRRQLEPKNEAPKGMINVSAFASASPSARIIAVPVPKSAGRMLPVLGQAVGGDEGQYLFNGSILDYVSCPPSLENVPNAYAVFIDGESMMPRYRPGETVWVHPGKPPRRGDDVIVQIKPPIDNGSDPWGYAKEYIGRQGNKLVLRQYNPAKEIEFEIDQVISVHPIVLAGRY